MNRIFKNLENEKLYEFYNCDPSSEYLDNTKYKEISQKEIDEIILQQEKDVIKSKIKQKRSKLAEFSSIEYKGKYYSNSQNARNAISNIIMLLIKDSDVKDYFTYDKIQVTLLKSDFINILNLIVDNEINLRNNENITIAKIDKLKTISKCQELVDNFC